MFIVSIVVIALIQAAQSQSNLIWQVPTEFEAKTMALVMSFSLGERIKVTTITFENRFEVAPNIILSISSLDTITSDVKINQQSSARTQTYFAHQLSIFDPSKKVLKLKISYAALNLQKFYFFYPHSFSISTVNLRDSDNPDTEYYEVQYLTALNPLKIYQLGIVLTGFEVSTIYPITISVDIELYIDTSYLIKGRTRSGKLKSIQVTRFLLDQTVQEAQTVGLNELSLRIGSASHYLDGSHLFLPSQIDFYQSGTFHGIMGFNASFTCVNNGSIFSTPTPSASAQIGFIVFMEKMCHQNQPYFEPTTLTCYQQCTIRLFQLSLTECGLCHPSCYKCSGPSSNQCTECLASENRVLTGTQCVCTTPPGANGTCMSCNQFAAGCLTCNMLGCTACLNGCTLNNSLSCICPLCSANEYLSPHTGVCECLPQYFRNSNNVCDRCSNGCYLCSGSSTNCSECIDRYYLTGSTCLYFIESSFIVTMDHDDYFEEGDRCISKVKNTCLNQCKNSSRLYQNKCYDATCPPATFQIYDSFGNALCHHCPTFCLQCDCYYVCKKCSSKQYLTATGRCQACRFGCQTCQNSLTCITCIPGYRLTLANICQQDLPVFTQLCLQGCSECVIQEYCEICKEGYYLLEHTHQCVPCNISGLQLHSATLINQQAFQVCEEVCGDGILINAQCDDGNRQQNDGCSASCKIQQSYECQYLTSQKRSICFQPNYRVVFYMEKSLQRNVINITVSGEGIDCSRLPYQIDCNPNGVLVSEVVIGSNKTYEIELIGPLQSNTCKFYIPESIQIKNETCNVSTYPYAYPFAEDNQVLSLATTTMKYTYKPLAFTMWALCLLGIDPYDLWISYFFVVMYLTTMHDFSHQPPNIYLVYSELRYFVFDYEQGQGETHNFNSSWKILVFIGGVIAWHEVAVRFLKSYLLFPITQVKIFSEIFANRFILYASVYNIFQPITIYYTISILTNQTEAYLGIIISCLHIILSAISLLLICIESSRLLKVKSHRKFLLIFIAAKELIIYQPLVVYFSKDAFFLSACVLMFTFIFLAIIALADGYLERPPESLKDSDSDSTSSSAQSVEEEQSKGSNCWMLFKTYVRKINLLLQFSFFGIICALRLFYWSDGKISSKYETIGIGIMVVFVFGNFLLSAVLGLASQVASLVLYAQAQYSVSENSSEHAKSMKKVYPQNSLQNIKDRGSESDDFNPE